jgi:flagellar basal-body rod protein FlgB
MGPVYLFDLVSRRNQWLSVRQSAIAGNIANANTPAYRARDVEPFSAALDAARVGMTATRQGHLPTPGAGQPNVQVSDGETWETQHSGNTVSLEQELLKAGEVSGAYRLNTGVLKAFHRMILASSRG